MGARLLVSAVAGSASNSADGVGWAGMGLGKRVLAVVRWFERLVSLRCGAVRCVAFRSVSLWSTSSHCFLGEYNPVHGAAKLESRFLFLCCSRIAINYLGSSPKSDLKYTLY